MYSFNRVSCSFVLCTLFLVHILIAPKSAIKSSKPYDVPSYEQFRQNLFLADPENDIDADLSDGRIISDQELLVQLAPLLASRSVENVATFLKNDAVTLNQRLSLLDVIISDSAYGFTHEDAIQLVLDVANMYDPGSVEQEKLFEVLLKYKDLLKQVSPVFIALENDYSRTYLPLLAWAVKNAANNPAVQEDLLTLKKRALIRAVDIGNTLILDRIRAFAEKGISAAEATDLVWHIARSGNHPELLSKLHEFGADINATHEKTTPLIEAVERGHPEVVSQLINLHADVNKFVDPEYGTALQRAIARRDVAIEEMLRSAGARE